MLDTSGLLLTENKDGSIIIEYEDYGTSLGGDFSSIYNLDKENANLLRKVLKEKYNNLSLKEALIEEVGINLNDSKLQQLLYTNNIKYDHSTWLS